MYDHYDHYEDEETHEMEETKTHNKPFKFPQDNFMGSCEEENMQQDSQCPNRKNYQETQETMKNKAEEANQIKGRTIQNSKYTKKISNAQY